MCPTPAGYRRACAGHRTEDGPPSSLNSPNNPVGAYYSRENLEAFAALFARKEEELGRKLYVISDEPYREITYGAEVPHVPCVWPAHHRVPLVLEVAVAAGRAHRVSVRVRPDGRRARSVHGGGRRGPRWASSARRCCSSALSRAASTSRPTWRPTRANRELLTTALGELGYEFVEPQGAFYPWVRALEDDAQAFSDRAKAHELLLVPSDGFWRRRLGARELLRLARGHRAQRARVQRLSKNRTKAKGLP